MTREISKLLRELDSELASLGARMAMGQETDLRMLLNYSLDLERWLSRAKVLDGTWQDELIRRTRIVGEGLRQGRTLDYGLERLMRLIILASENLDLSQLPLEQEEADGDAEGSFSKC